ncbi:hypothetical protein DFJ58DRAFT_913524 [Suillus subalutaceus]|uniref:uncharacterized protein n=1 Tax=Suillus subalutaceus TaxID=48586 RepID=UPI001B86E4B7|nr:uncharacterized protein DFJ58DRAFT_913524 [Suillus subalutaceus]KAG1857393.1 hypothetical protein DFJ58DRAFT_913524 [Suillus subalutaceus]
MHVYLLPTEILIYIFTVNDDEESYNRRPFFAQLAVLARTCRKFKEPALDILWKHVYGFKPLISCLPEGVSYIDMAGNLTLRRPFLAGEWRLIHQYARRVHSFAVNSSQLDMIDNHVMQALMSAPSSTSLFPNLRRLRWSDDREHFFPLLRYPPWVNYHINPGGLYIYTSLVCPICVKVQMQFVKLCLACGSFAVLKQGPSVHESFFRLAYLPSLKSLYFRLRTYDTHEMQSNFTPTISPKLNEVDLTASSQSVVEHFLRNVPLPSCRSAKVYIDYDDLDDEPEVPYDPLHIPDFVVSLSECFSPALEKLHVEFEFDFSTYIGEGIIANRSYVLGFNAVAPLMPFHRLTDLRLDWMCTSAINDASFKTLVQSWPQLEQFHFGGAAYWLVPPSMTFTAFVHLIRHCPRLHTVQMSFCATPVDYANDPFFFETIPNEKIITLSVGMSPISDPCAVGYILLRLLPKLGDVDFLGWLDDDIPVQPPFEHLEDGWNAVNEILAANNQRRLK